MSKTKRDDSNGFEAWGSYMSAKKQKLTNQFTKKAVYEHSLGEEQSSQIFNGVSIYVNGYTNPTAENLKRLMIHHGGIYHHYYSRTKTTHIIATNLPDSKVKELKDEKVVRPEWITDSVNAGRLLPYTNYLLYTPNLTKGQKVLPFKTVSSVNQEDQRKAAVASSDGIQGTEDSASLQPKNGMLPDEDLDSANVTSGNQQKKLIATSLPNNDSEKKTEGQNEASPFKQSVNADSKKAQNATPTARDPNFISEFYNHSRLHHIATARSELREYVQQLASLNNGSFPKRKELRERFSKCSENIKTQHSFGKQKVIMHIDMDCFFVSVGLRSRPELIGKPVAVTHSKTGRGRHQPGSDAAYEMKQWRRLKVGAAKPAEDLRPDEDEDPETAGTTAESEANWDSLSEVASCSYEARKAGIRNGMMVGQAVKLCPDLQFIPYDFDGYKEVSKTLYNIIASYTLDVEAVSCDELYVDCTDVLSETNVTPEEFAAYLRQEIKEKTGCNASAGLGSNLLLARLATKAAKPNGQFYLSPGEEAKFMATQSISDLPGVGYAISSKLEAMNINSCADLQKMSLIHLQKEFGPKTGLTLYNHCRGTDDRVLKVAQERKSVSAEVNYGIRFQELNEANEFMMGLAKEVQERLKHVERVGRTITLKLKVRREDAPTETAKFLGHGICDNATKSTKLHAPTNDFTIIGKECIKLFQNMQIKPQDLRGVGIQIGHLEPESKAKNGPKQATLNFATTVASSAGVAKEDAAGKQQSEGRVAKDDELAIPGTSKEVLPRSNSGTSEFILPSLSQIDQEVLAELPDDIRHQIEQEYKNSHQAVGSTSGQFATNNDEDIPLHPVLNGLPDFSQLDVNVLDELPEDVRREVLEAYSSESKTSSPKKISVASANKSSSPKKKTGSLSKGSPTKEAALKNQRTIVDHFVKKNSSEKAVEVSKPHPVPKQPKVTLCGVDKLEDVRVLLKEWVESTRAPLDEDILMFQTYMTNLFMEKNLEKVDLIVKHFYRLVKSSCQQEWQQVYLDVANEVQTQMLINYGSVLKIKTEF